MILTYFLLHVPKRNFIKIEYNFAKKWGMLLNANNLYNVPSHWHSAYELLTIINAYPTNCQV